MSITSRALLAGLVLCSAAPACNADFTLVRNCPLTSYNRGDQYLLDYELEIPRNCPVPLGSAGEIKSAGAFIYDYGNSDFRFGHMVITNSDRQFVQNRSDVFRFEAVDRQGNPVERYTAFPRANYPASTAGYLTSDYGRFIASNSGSALGNPGDPYGEVTITYQRSDIHMAVRGTRIPLSGVSATWTTEISGGLPPYEYAWYRDGTYVGAAASYTGSGSRDFILRAEVTDAALASRAAVFSVDVDGVIASLSGPNLTYASSGGGTWTAEGAGGYPPYAYSWWVDDAEVGNGPAWTGYPGEGTRLLRVDLTDSRGAHNSASLPVRGVGNESCTPAPPALTC